MPTFEEFAHLYLHHNPQIHTVINKFNVVFWSSFRINQDLLEEAKRAGIRTSDLPDWAYMAAHSEADLRFFGDVVAFVPPMQKNLDYFVVSHPFDSVTVQEKLAERQAQTSYMGHPIFETVLVKTICLMHPDKGYILVSLPGNAQIDWKKIPDALGLPSRQRSQIRPYAGSLEEAVGMLPGKVTPLVQASKLPNMAAVLIDSGLEKATAGSDERCYLELPLNIHTELITMSNSNVLDVWRKDPARHQNDIKGPRDNALVYDPRRHSLAQALEACYGHGKVMVAEIARTQA
ncbi:hypothetical protein HYU16_03760 [Candidatus Woesearchaeota archaeon]|nr:hypothetical protein [Candidatus Woesearchaeota archaeon]